VVARLPNVEVDELRARVRVDPHPRSRQLSQVGRELRGSNAFELEVDRVARAVTSSVGSPPGDDQHARFLEMVGGLHDELLESHSQRMGFTGARRDLLEGVACGGVDGPVARVETNGSARTT
jgi:hypothetical protein